MLAKRFAIRRGQPELLWAVAMVMFGLASLALTAGVLSGWTRTLFEVYWAFGAVLNVPFLAGGELVLLFRRRWVVWAVWLGLIFSIAFTFAVLRGATVGLGVLLGELPSGKHVCGDGTAEH